MLLFSSSFMTYKLLLIGSLQVLLHLNMNDNKNSVYAKVKSDLIETVYTVNSLLFHLIILSTCTWLKYTGKLDTQSHVMLYVLVAGFHSHRFLHDLKTVQTSIEVNESYQSLRNCCFSLSIIFLLMVFISCLYEKIEAPLNSFLAVLLRSTSVTYKLFQENILSYMVKKEFEIVECFTSHLLLTHIPFFLHLSRKYCEPFSLRSDAYVEVKSETEDKKLFLRFWVLIESMACMFLLKLNFLTTLEIVYMENSTNSTVAVTAFNFFCLVSHCIFDHFPNILIFS